MNKIKTLKGFKIYEDLQRRAGDLDYRYQVYLPEESPSQFSTPEFECDNLQECIDNINSYEE